MASSWLNQSRDDRKSKTRPRNKHQIIRQIEWTIEAKLLHESQGEPRGERDLIRLRNPTEDKRAFRQMLTSADLPTGQRSRLKEVIQMQISSDINVVVIFLSQVIFVFLLFLSMVMYANEVQTKEK